MRFTFELAWRARPDFKFAYDRKERVKIFIFDGVDGWGIYASPISFTLVLPLITVMMDGTVLPWLPNKIRELYRRVREKL
jgi:hypothetical protein